MLAAFNNLVRLLISFNHVVVFIWLAYWCNRFYRSHRRGENGITLGLALLFLSLALDRLWSVSAAIYTAFDVSELFTMVSLVIRFTATGLTILALVFITWKFSTDGNQNSNQ